MIIALLILIFLALMVGPDGLLAIALFITGVFCMFTVAAIVSGVALAVL